MKCNQVPDHPLLGVAYGNTQITHGPHFNHSPVLRKHLRQTIRHVTNPSLNHLHTRSSGQVVFELRTKISVLEISEGASPQIGQAFSDENPADAQALSQMLDQRAKEFLAG